MLHSLQIKRIDDSACIKDGYRILIERYLPEPNKSIEVQYDLWIKEISPSTSLCLWYNQESAKQEEFESRYFKELEHHKEWLDKILLELRKHNVTLLYHGQQEHVITLVQFLQYYLLKTSIKD
jgi:uncharacterized protein YeaO (DUF488 family)